ncbi:MAG: hypothetical protein ACYCPA_10345, partial [Acidithiobacillus sp.]
MPDELIERNARAEVMDLLYNQALVLRKLTDNPLFLIPEYAQIMAKLKSIEAQLMAIQAGVCQGSCRVSHFLSGLFILSLRVQI